MTQESPGRSEAQSQEEFAMSPAPAADQVLPLAIARHAERSPASLFLRERGGVQLTYAQTQHAALVWARVLRDAGVREGDAVISLFPNRASCVTAWLGLAWLGAIEVPVHTAYHGDMLAYVFNDAKAQVAVVHESFLQVTGDVASRLQSLQRVIVVRDDAGGAILPAPASLQCDEFVALAGEPLPAQDCITPAPHTVGTIIYTSGTTGNSKGVMVPWRQLWQTAEGLDPLVDIDGRDVFYCPHPLFHNGGKSVVSLMGLRGGTVVLRDRFSTTEFWADIRHFGCTSAMLIGSMAGFLEAQPPRPDDADSPLRNVYPVPLPADPAAFARRFDVRLHAWFGMSECGIPIAAEDWKADRDTGCGRARPGFQCRLVDANDEEVPDGAVGELVIRSDAPWMLNAGYWGMPEKTLEAWRNLWFHTGDAMRKDAAGRFHFVDRWKDAIRRRGENISSIEVERYVNHYPAVQESAAIGVASEWGEQEVMVVVVPRDGATVDPAALVSFLAGRVPRFMLPRYVRVVQELPRTPTGKVRKVELRTQGGSGVWDREKAK
jgi:carnitine-CoA ligase